MAFCTFDEIEKYVVEQGLAKKVALCGAHDRFALEALVNAKRIGVIDGVLIGDKREIIKLLAEFDEPIEDYEIFDEPDEVISAKMAVKMVKEGKADIPMKGLMQSSSYLRAILDKENGILPAGKVLSECTVFEFSEQKRFVFAGDCAMNITPGVAEKVEIIKNSAELAHKFGIEKPKVACLSALEKVNPKMQSSVDAAELAAMDWHEACEVEGPFALDNAVDLEAAQHKGITGGVAGKADVLLMANLDMGNVFHKAIHFFAHARMASALCGTEYPVIFTSRTDSPEGKYNSILVAVMQAIN